MKLLVGLGNPGDKYKDTRHNVGFILADEIAKDLDAAWSFEKDFNAYVAKSPTLILVKPQTFMNDSGTSVSKVLAYYKLALDDLIVINDDVDLPFGEVRYKKASGSAGHHGVEDIIEKLGSKEFWRYRVGIGRPENKDHDIYHFVLGAFSAESLEFLKSKALELSKLILPL